MLELVSDFGTTKTEIDLKNKVVVGTLKGNVTFLDYKEMFMSIGELIRVGQADSLIMDRIIANEIDAKGRLWLKNEAFKEYADAVKMTKKMAVIKSKSIIGNLYSGTIYPAVKLFYPDLTIKEFSSFDNAYNWILE